MQLVEGDKLFNELEGCSKVEDEGKWLGKPLKKLGLFSIGIVDDEEEEEEGDNNKCRGDF